MASFCLRASHYFLSAWDAISDKHCVVKILQNYGSHRKAKDQEAHAVQLLRPGMDDNFPLVKYQLVELKPR